MKKLGFFAVLILCLAAASFAAGGTEQGGAASAELGNYPSRPVQCIIPTAAGGGNDSVVRIVQKYIDLAQPIAVVNVPGANNLIGAMQFYQSPADAYTIIGWAPVDMISMNLTGRSEHEFWNIFEPIAAVASDFMLASAGSASGFRTIEDMVNFARANPGAVKVGTVGVRGIGPALVGIITNHFNIEITHVPYDNGTQAGVALLGNHVEVLVASVVDMRGGLDSGDFAPLMVANDTRIKSLPNVPTFIERGINVSIPMPRA